MFLQSRQCLSAHAAFANHGANAIALDDFALVRLFADAGRRARGRDAVPAAFLRDDGTAVIED